MQCTLGNGAGGSVAGEFSGGRRPLPRPGISRDDCAAQSVAQPAPEAPLIGSVILQILMQRRCYGVFYGGLHPMGREAGAGPLAKTGCSATPFPRPVRELRGSGARSYAGERTLSKRRMLPMLPIWMMLFRDHAVRWRRRQNQEKSEGERLPHANGICKYFSDDSNGMTWWLIAKSVRNRTPVARTKKP